MFVMGALFLIRAPLISVRMILNIILHPRHFLLSFTVIIKNMIKNLMGCEPNLHVKYADAAAELNGDQTPQPHHTPTSKYGVRVGRGRVHEESCLGQISSTELPITF